MNGSLNQLRRDRTQQERCTVSDVLSALLPVPAVTAPLRLSATGRSFFLCSTPARVLPFGAKSAAIQADAKPD